MKVGELIQWLNVRDWQDADVFIRISEDFKVGDLVEVSHVDLKEGMVELS